MTRARGVQVGARGVQRRKVVRKGRTRPAQPKLQAPDLNRPLVDVSRATYLSVPEAVEYLRFGSAPAFYMWVGRHQIPKCRTGRRLLFLRRDLDEAVQAKDRKAIRETRRVS